ncbi:uncharacterized protein LOC144172319 [Haemaphysalis longicornis]
MDVPLLALLLAACLADTASAPGGPPLLCDMPKEVKSLLFLCARKILEPHVVSLLQKRSKRLFKGRDVIDAVSDMCVEGSQIVNNYIALTVMQIKEPDKVFSENSLWNCLNATRYVMVYGRS